MTRTDAITYKIDIAREIHSLGMGLLQVGRIREAAFQFKKAHNLAPDFPDAALALGHCLHTLGHFEAALGQYDQLITTTPQLMAAWNNRGITLLELGRHEEAAECFLRALELEPEFHDARVALATCFQSLGKVDLALAVCDTVLAKAPENAEAHWNRSLLLLLKRALVIRSSSVAISPWLLTVEWASSSNVNHRW